MTITARGAVRQRDLAGLLARFFSETGLRRFIRGLPSGDLSAELPGPGTSLVELADATVQVLERHGAIRDEFWTALIEERPLRRDAIEAVRRAPGQQIRGLPRFTLGMNAAVAALLAAILAFWLLPAERCARENTGRALLEKDWTSSLSLPFPAGASTRAAVPLVLYDGHSAGGAPAPGEVIEHGATHQKAQREKRIERKADDAKNKFVREEPISDAPDPRSRVQPRGEHLRVSARLVIGESWTPEGFDRCPRRHRGLECSLEGHPEHLVDESDLVVSPQTSPDGPPIVNRSGRTVHCEFECLPEGSLAEVG